jgi:hypothetical protein
VREGDTEKKIHGNIVLSSECSDESAMSDF